MAALSAASAIVASGCSSSPEAFRLQGTSWQLVSIQSMDDEQGTTTVPDPSRFTVSFDEAGTASFLIDCNRGSGTVPAAVA